MVPALTALRNLRECATDAIEARRGSCPVLGGKRVAGLSIILVTVPGRGYPAQEAHGRGTIDIDRTDSLAIYRMILVGREGSKRQVGADGHGGVGRLIRYTNYELGQWMMYRRPQRWYRLGTTRGLVGAMAMD